MTCIIPCRYICNVGTIFKRITVAIFFVEFYVPFFSVFNFCRIRTYYCFLICTKFFKGNFNIFYPFIVGTVSSNEEIIHNYGFLHRICYFQRWSLCIDRLSQTYIFLTACNYKQKRKYGNFVNSINKSLSIHSFYPINFYNKSIKYKLKENSHSLTD